MSAVVQRSTTRPSRKRSTVWPSRTNARPVAGHAHELPAVLAAQVEPHRQLVTLGDRVVEPMCSRICGRAIFAAVT